MQGAMPGTAAGTLWCTFLKSSSGKKWLQRLRSNSLEVEVKKNQECVWTGESMVGSVRLDEKCPSCRNMGIEVYRAGSNRYAWSDEIIGTSGF